MILIQTKGLVINGWNIFAHPLFLIQVETLILQVEQLQKKDPITFNKKKCCQTSSCN